MAGPQRVLIVSANMGEGHNATGRALDQAVRANWPGVTVEWLDTLDVMGRGVGPVFREIYVTNVRRTPWLYEFFYGAVRRWRWLANSSKRFVGSWCGRRLARHIARFQPDLILSTYPLGSAGLAWLRRHRGLRTPMGAWVSDFSPHPFWVYAELDLNLVMHDVAVRPATEWVPGARVRVSAPPVTAGFAPGDRATARARHGLPDGGFVALVSCGAFAFGSVESGVRVLLGTGDDVVVVVACGRNDALRKRLMTSHPAEAAAGRLRALEWTNDMAGLTVASDVVVTNAGGATSLEALACGRAVLMYRPIAAHGRANADLMAAAGLAEVCVDDAELAAAVYRLRTEPDRLAAIERASVAHSAAGMVADSLTALLAVAGSSDARRRLRPEDALFVHVQTPEVPQQVGAVLILDAKPDGSPATLADAAHLFGAAPGLLGRIDPGSAWRHPRWVAVPGATVADLVTPVDLGGDGPSDLDGAMDAFFSVPIDGTAGTGHAQLVRGMDGGRSALLIKLHHAGADGIAVTGALVGRARGQEFIAEPAPVAATERPTVRQRLGAGRELATGVLALARSGRAVPSELNGPVRSSDRHHSRVDLPVAEVRQVARALRTPTTDLATALIGEALHRVLHVDGARGGPDHLRMMMPRSTRTTRTFRTAGNRTWAASVDLPIGPMSLADRVASTRAATDRQVGSSAPHAAHAVVWLLGQLPPWLHAVAARLVYRSTWFNAIASVLPGARSPVVLNGSRVSVVYPVLALAPGVKLSIGVMTWADLLTFCFAGDLDIASTVDGLADAIRAAFKEARALVE
ncbi:MAG TPA: WS/DGAT domain-containing protein [Pseudonocardiaceae bacterium]|nr:WS/DGAT domain-containing protein [Pseudonocardiaceae bacterium]